jgi:pimeloyl-ACP methyl ester carboxylesterase
MWEPVSALLGERFEVLTPDLLGHGGSAPAPGDTTLETLADGVAGEIPEGSHLVGFSLGALVAQHIARYRPELVTTLTSVSSVCRRTTAERAAVLGRLRAAEEDFPAAAVASLRRWYDGTDVEPAWRRRTEATLLANDVPSFLSCYRVFATGDAEIGPELDQIAVPSLAITGADDAGSTPEMTNRLAAAMPRCQARVLDATRHMLPVQRPEQLADSLHTFIGEFAHV